MKYIKILLNSSLVFSGLLLSVSCAHKRTDHKNLAEDKYQTCMPTREYVTTFNYIEDHKDYAINAKDARKIADSVSKGCTGAAERFIKVTGLLSHAAIDTQTAMKKGVELALSTDAITKNFIVIFKNTYSEDALDLNVNESLKIATELSIDFKGNPKSIREDFKDLVEFCASAQELDLPKQKCAQMAYRISKLGEKFEGSVSDEFLNLFEYLSDTDGPNLTTFDALAVAEQALQYGPAAKENFIDAYKYAISDSGLHLTRPESVKFAKLMASRSLKEKKP